MTTYRVDHARFRSLCAIAARPASAARGSPFEEQLLAEQLAALKRLRDGAGTADDVEAAANLYELAGDAASAADLRRGCYGPLGPRP